MRIPFRLVDVFADRPLAGNQLCVVPDPEVTANLSTEAMQALTMEIGFSETTFVTSSSRDRYSMRIFTPGAEIPFAGHPTLGTTFVLVSEGRVSSPATQVVAAGEVPVEVDPEANTARMHQLPPAFGPPLQDAGPIAAAVGLAADDLDPALEPQVVSTGAPFLIVPLRDEAVVRAARPDETSLSAVLVETGAGGVYLFAAADDRALARMFAPDFGVSEDPATGSAAGPLGAYLARHGRISSGRLSISQGEQVGRPSTLWVEVRPDGDSWSVVVGGGVYVVGVGAFDVPL